MPSDVGSGRTRTAFFLGPRLPPIALLIALVTACGGATADDPGARRAAPTAAQGQSAGDPCSLITAAEAEKALGGPVGDPERPKEANMPPRMVTCRYVAQRGQGLAVMTLMVRRSDSASEASSGFRSAREQFAGAETVTGLGDEAFWFANQLNVLRGTVYLNLTGDFDRATAESLAQHALKRLP